jgi:hypothetical protein
MKFNQSTKLFPRLRERSMVGSNYTKVGVASIKAAPVHQSSFYSIIGRWFNGKMA